MATIINLTPHSVTIVNDDGEKVASYPSQGVARAASSSEALGFVPGTSVKMVRTIFGATEGLPAPAYDIFYIVSTIAAQAAKAEGRPTGDLLVPGGRMFRDANGQITGVTALAIVE